ncbi:KHG/KDPG aldolase (plasmid) [Variovorax sp. SRS16]|uniref:bifunctional 4-hydroxy-2-oxoglutarate aldolase/2-dehydro-3-deoxy-phosphogluconate aldolase n=1 Tax=Variovorax sp. SRS16 TaxID=282217 RepID=UPI001318B77A|nr:bifunctional 4-hydroxy-2-oxoglutarate aldolase/2-dehydro-3-deoxy-phosphogluconate aldolase [Variovorax sp. SRS16]VTU45908.1 KHG/KDPG aldolase [Variovorax sp. SRS16]
MNILQIMRTGPVIPVIVINRLEDAVPLARALVAGGVRVLELTLRTPVALKAIEAIANEVEGAMIGVGTITRPEDFDASVKAGALFGVSPGLTPELIAASKDSSLPLLPGVMTPSDVITARAAGFTQLKLFPAQQAGGVGMLKALGGPFPDLAFCPTGGISLATAPEFLALPNVACVGGSWLTPGDAIASRDWGRIAALARGTVSLGQAA